MKHTLWDRIAKKYTESISADKTADFAYEKLINTLSILSLCDNSGNALDLGCGDGRFTRELESRYENVYAVDVSKKLLSVAKEVCKKTRFFLADLEMPFPDFDITFDLVTCKLLLMYLDNIETLAENSYKVLNKKGILIVSVTHPIKWTMEYLKGNVGNNAYTGYLSETNVFGKIAGDKDLKFEFKNRTFQTYINTFTKHGFVLENVLETGVPDSFVVKYPRYLAFQKKPYRLNMKFVKP